MFNRLLDTDVGNIIMSVIWGLGLAALFRRACKNRNCIVFKAPPVQNMNNKVFKYDNKCYKYTTMGTKCNKNSIKN